MESLSRPRSRSKWPREFELSADRPAWPRSSSATTPPSHVYVRGKRRDAEEVGMTSIHHELPSYSTQERVESLIAELNQDSKVDGILVQLPLPEGLDGEAVVGAIDQGKDADGLHPANLGRLVLDQPGLRPCTPSGIMRILDHYEIPIRGAKAVVLGRSFLVGRPMALLLGARGVDATVTVAHSRSRDLRSLILSADLVVAAIGSPRFVTADMVRPGAVVVDVGINRIDDRAGRGCRLRSCVRGRFGDHAGTRRGRSDDPGHASREHLDRRPGPRLIVLRGVKAAVQPCEPWVRG